MKKIPDEAKMDAKTYCLDCIHKEMCGWYPRTTCNHYDVHLTDEEHGKNDSKARSKTFRGIAEAMASQWGKELENE